MISTEIFMRECADRGVAVVIFKDGPSFAQFRADVPPILRELDPTLPFAHAKSEDVVYRLSPEMSVAAIWDGVEVEAVDLIPQPSIAATQLIVTTMVSQNDLIRRTHDDVVQTFRRMDHPALVKIVKHLQDESDGLRSDRSRAVETSRAMARYKDAFDRAMSLLRRKGAK